MTRDPALDAKLEQFDNANKHSKGKRLSWEKRARLIEQQFPVAANLNWNSAFDGDLDLFAWIMQDVLKADGALPGRSGPKPGVDYRAGIVRLRQMMGDDYTVLPFSEAFAVLAAGLSVTQLARKTGLSRSQVHRILRGEADPDGYEMECIAKAFNKQGGYFVEYRRAAVIAALAEKMDKHPDATVKYWREFVLAGA